MNYVDCQMKSSNSNEGSGMTLLGSTLGRGFQCFPKVDLNADFFVSKVRNQELGCLLWGGVAGCIAGLLLPGSRL
jgi:hypothetical protein